MGNNFRVDLKKRSINIYNVLRYAAFSNKLSPTRFIIFGRGRSGSTALVKLLNSIPGVRCEGEILNKIVLFPYFHVLVRCANSGADAYGCKILSYQINRVQPIPNRERFLSRLYDTGFKIVYLKRENLLFHALSNIRARVYGFHKKASDCYKVEKININFNELLHWIKGSEALNQYEKILLKGVPHLPLTYEKHIAFEGSHQSTIDLICRFLGVESKSVKSEYRKVSPRTFRSSVANYDELAARLRDTPYASYLDDNID